jgi:hypothetical protein
MINVFTFTYAGNKRIGFLSNIVDNVDDAGTVVKPFYDNSAMLLIFDSEYLDKK